jgi:hypothetical protein
LGELAKVIASSNGKVEAQKFEGRHRDLEEVFVPQPLPVGKRLPRVVGSTSKWRLEAGVVCVPCFGE